MTTNFKVGDIICKTTYPGRDIWKQVCQVLKVHPTHYVLQPIQSRTTERDWSTDSTISGATYLRRGGWEEEQTCLFNGTTLKQKKNREDEELRSKIRQIVREELALASGTEKKIQDSLLDE